MATKVEDVFGQFLRPYQRRFVEDWSRRIVVLKSRRIGFTEAVLIKALLIAKATPYHDVYLCSTSFNNAKEMLRRMSIWLEALGRSGRDVGVTSVKKTEIEFDNGSRIIPMPALSVRSRTGTIILDEFAFYQRDRDVWAGIAPVADTDPSLRVIVISTPFGASGMFWEIFNDPNGEHGEWSRHKIDVYEAAAEGFPVDPEELKGKYPSDIWHQEFLCKFMSDINQYFSHDLIRRSQWTEDDLFPTGERYFGIDLASRKDASCLADATKVSREFWVKMVHTIKAAGESMDYSPQFDVITKMLRGESYDGGAVDGTGEGAQLGQDLQTEFGHHIVKSVNGSGDWKDVYSCVPDILLGMEQGIFRIPNDIRVRSAFTKIQKKTTTNNTMKFEATRDADGHADEFSAILLAYARAHVFHLIEMNSTIHTSRGYTPL